MIYEIRGLKFSYDKKRKILDGINFDIEKGDLLCVLGQNGSGKSTLFKCLLGLLNNYEGNIYLKGKDIKTLKEKEITKTIAYVSQDNESTFSFTVFEYILMGLASDIKLFSHPGKKEEERTKEILIEMNLERFAQRSFNELSGGERQQIAIARALVGKPEILLFDEPTAHLDYANQISVLEMIRELNKKGYTILSTTHDPNHAIMLNGKVALLDNGGVEVGTVNEIINEDKLQDIYGKSLKIRYIEEFHRNVCIQQML